MSDKRKRSLSIKDLIKEDPPKKDKKEKCSDVQHGDPDLLAQHTERVTTRLDALQASIDRLLALCLQEEPDDSLEEVV